MTVSLALRNDFAVAESTRKKVKELAEEMGYQRDPLLSLHMAKLRRGGSSRYRPKLAFLNPHPYKEKLQESPAQAAFLKGAQERAKDLGYEVEELWLGEDAFKTCSLKTYFKRKGIHGFLCLGEPLDRGIPWDCFPAVVVGYTMTSVGLHRVCNNQRRSAQMVIREMSRLGFKRVGMAMRRELDLELDENYSSAFLCAQSWLKPENRVPLFRPGKWERDAFFKWLDEAKVEAVAGLEYEHIRPFLKEYKRRGTRR
jgi:LacI family transcriptional regulator